MDCCCLSAEEVGRLRHYGIFPDHEEHTHINSKDAIAGVLNDELELIEGKDGRYYVTRTLEHVLRAMPSGVSHIRIIQRIRGVPLLELKPIR